MKINLVGCPAVVLLSFVFVALTSAFVSPANDSKLRRPSQSALRGSGQTKTLTFADRVAYKRAIEEVYWRHRIWPNERPDPKPSLDAVMSQAQIEKKVEDYLRDSQTLEDYWQRPITPEQL
jgi:hypothetical protein